MLLQPPPQFIDVPVRPITVAGIVFQRIQRYMGMDPRQDPVTGEMVMVLTVWVMHFVTNADGTPGESAEKLLAPYKLIYRADNTEAIDTNTGEIVFTRTHESDQQWHDLLLNDPRTLIGRGDAYRNQLFSGPQDLVPAITAAMQAADGPPYYRFGRD